MEYNKKHLNGWALPEEAFEWILNNIPEGSTILELGSGSGTKELVKFYNVYSVEQDQKWMGYEPKSNYIYAPLKSYPNNIQGSQGWYDEERLFAGIPDKYDLLIIDGPIAINRGNFINFCERFNVEVPFLIDDTQRKLDREMALEVAKKLNKSVTEVTGHQKKFIILK